MAWWNEPKRRWLPYEEWKAKKDVEKQQDADAREAAFLKIKRSSRIQRFLKGFKKSKQIERSGGRRLPLQLLKDIRDPSAHLNIGRPNVSLPLTKKGWRNIDALQRRRDRVQRFARRDPRSIALQNRTKERSDALRWSRYRAHTLRQARAQVDLAHLGEQVKALRHRTRQFGTQLKLADIGKAAKKREQEMLLAMEERQHQAELANMMYLPAATPMEIVERGLAAEAYEKDLRLAAVRDMKRRREDAQELALYGGNETAWLLNKRSRGEEFLHPMEGFSSGAVALRNKVAKSKKAAEARLAVSEARNERKRKMETVKNDFQKRKAARMEAMVEAEAVERMMRPVEAEVNRNLQMEIDDAAEEEEFLNNLKNNYPDGKIN